MTATLAATLADTLEFVERALARKEEGHSPEAEAHKIRAYLVNTLELVERDPGIEAAADDLYSVTAAFVTGDQQSDHGPERRDRRVLREAFIRLRDKLTAARPSDKARGMGLDAR